MPYINFIKNYCTKTNMSYHPAGFQQLEIIRTFILTLCCRQGASGYLVLCAGSHKHTMALSTSEFWNTRHRRYIYHDKQNTTDFTSVRIVYSPACITHHVMFGCDKIPLSTCADDPHIPLRISFIFTDEEILHFLYTSVNRYLRPPTAINVLINSN